MGEMPILPQDLIKEILVRVPASNLKRLRSTCKQWYALFNDRRFAKKHFLKAKQQFLMIRLADNTINSINLDLQGTHPTLKPSGIILRFDDITDNVKVESVFHCHGLLLCLTKDLRLFVWNPSLEQVKWIESRDNFGLTNCYSLGYDKKKDMYKILIFPVLSLSCNPSKIFDLNSNSWRILDNDDNLGFLACLTFSNSVSLKGNAYWIAQKIRTEKEFTILSFDFTREKFGCLSTPPLLEGKSMDLASVRDGRLLVLVKHGDELGMEFWMSGKIDEEAAMPMCWSKLFKVDFNEAESCFVTSFLVDEENKLAVFTYYNVRESVGRIYGCGNGLLTVEVDKYYRATGPKQPKLLSYAPSLVQIL